MNRRDAIRAFVDEARGVTCESEALRRGWKLRRSGAELAGPCPACGGTDRFAINRVKNTFVCRKAGRGGDAIEMVMYVDAIDFLSACSVLTGRPIPDRDANAPDPAVIAAREKAREEERIRRDLEAEAFREKARKDAYRTWVAGRPATGTPVEAYLQARGLRLLPIVRALPELPYWHGKGEAVVALHRGWAMLLPVQRPDGSFGALHSTWVDPARPGKKMVLHDPSDPNGDALPAKKVRGAKKGGAVRLTRTPGAVRLVVGEGFETTQSVMVAEARGDTDYWVAVDLGNLGGRAASSLTHPHLTRTDKAGRVRRASYPGPDPDMTDQEAFVPPAGYRQVIFLGDGDSDRTTTEAALIRGARRAMRHHRGLDARIAWAPEGADFNDVLMRGVGV